MSAEASMSFKSKIRQLLGAKHRGARPGYTMVEVMMGLSVLAIGASSIIALQRFAIMGTATSRHVTNATNVTAGVLETINIESNSWTVNSGANETTMPWLGRAINNATVPAGVWQTPAHNLYGFTLEGDVVDPDLTTGAVAYCTHIRALLLGPVTESAPGLNDQADAVRIEARTFYAKSGRSIANECGTWSPDDVTILFSDAENELAVSGEPNRKRDEYGIIYLSTIVRRPN